MAGNPKGNPQNLKPFKKGFDERRNINGAPPKSIEKIIIDGNYDMDGVIAMLYNKATSEKDVRAAEVLLSYAYAKPKQSIDLTSDGEAISMPIVKIER